MKEAEYFHRAFQDVEFRREKILELREHRKLFRNLSIGFGIILVACIVTTGLAEGHWLDGFGGMLGSMILMAWVHNITTIRLVALEVMDGQGATPQPAVTH